MTTYYSNLLEQFKKISKEKWIKSINNDHGGVGMTFEHKLGKKSDSLFLPDYEGIELKCTTRYSNYPLYLFTIAFDGPTFPEINRLIKLYGHTDKNYKDKKVLYAKLNLINPTIVNYKYKFILTINKKEDKLYLKISQLNDKLIEMKSFVYLSSIYDHVMIKLKKMAIVYASKMQKNNEDYFRYYKISIYELISYEKFIEAFLYHETFGIGVVDRNLDFFNREKNDFTLTRCELIRLPISYKSPEIISRNSGIQLD